jgi:glutaconate CoA-transferase subunit A
LKPDIVDKVMTIEEAVSMVPDESHISIGGFTTQRHPMAFIHEMIRQGRSDLHLYGTSPGGDWDFLIGAGCVRRVEMAYEADEAFATIGPRFRNAIERGLVEWEDYTNFAMIQRFAAGAMGVPFMPTRTMLGSDLLKKEGFDPGVRKEDSRIARSKYAVMDCPFTDDRVVLLPAIQTDFTIIHAQVVDREGTVRIYGQNYGDREQAKCAKKLIVTCERVYEHGALREFPEHNSIPHFCVDAIVEVPFGSHPYACHRCYDYDPEFLRMYHSMARTDEGFREFLDEYILGVGSWDEYLEKIGKERLERLRADSRLGYSPELKRC